MACRLWPVGDAEACGTASLAAVGGLAGGGGWGCVVRGELEVLMGGWAVEVVVHLSVGWQVRQYCSCDSVKAHTEGSRMKDR